MSTTLTNGRQRKALAEQIDRLDSVLDGLADGLNEAVATAVKETVHAVLSEVLSNPEAAGLGCTRSSKNRPARAAGGPGPGIASGRRSAGWPPGAVPAGCGLPRRAVASAIR